MTSPHTSQAKRKLYCYVDESGQDSNGRLFIVAVAIIGEDREKLRARLSTIEERSRKGTRKWTQATPRQRKKYIKDVLSVPGLAGRLYYSFYKTTRAYVDLTVLSTAKAINMHAPFPYTASILVDGLHSRMEQHRFATGLRRLRVNARKVRGLKDESDVFIRLADSIAGFVRDTHTGYGDARLSTRHGETLWNKVLIEI